MIWQSENGEIEAFTYKVDSERGKIIFTCTADVPFEQASFTISNANGEVLLKEEVEMIKGQIFRVLPHKDFKNSTITVQISSEDFKYEQTIKV